MAARLPKDRLFAQLMWVHRGYANARDLGEVPDSRTAIRSSENGGRLPDLLFVRKERAEILQERAVYRAPDLVVEILSPGDRRSHAVALETEYRQPGVREMWLIDRAR